MRAWLICLTLGRRDTHFRLIQLPHNLKHVRFNRWFYVLSNSHTHFKYHFTRLLRHLQFFFLGNRFLLPFHLALLLLLGNLIACLVCASWYHVVVARLKLPSYCSYGGRLLPVSINKVCKVKFFIALFEGIMFSLLLLLALLLFNRKLLLFVCTLGSCKLTHPQFV